MADRSVSPLRTYHVWQAYRFEAELDNRAVALVDGLEGFDTYHLRIEGGSMTAFRLAGAVLELALQMRAREDALAEQELDDATVYERARTTVFSEDDEQPVTAYDAVRWMLDSGEADTDGRELTVHMVIQALGLRDGSRFLQLMRMERAVDDDGVEPF